MLNYMASDLCVAKQLSQYVNGIQPFPRAEAYGKIAAHDSSSSRSPCSHRCTGDLQITVDRSICVTSVHGLIPPFSVLQKLEVLQGTTEYS